MKKPKFSEDGDFVKVTFYFEKSLEIDELTTDFIISLIEKKGSIRPQDLSKLFPVSRSSITRRLTKLVEQGKIIRNGTGAGVQYRKHGDTLHQRGK